MNAGSSATYFKLGLLVLVLFAGLLTTAALLGLAHTREPTVTYHAYFDESVQGLGKGSTVMFRGVMVGSVQSISVAPDGRLVDVGLALKRSELKHMMLDMPPPDLRAQLGTQGLTGVKYVDIDFFPDAEPEILMFVPAKHHIASYPSMLKGLETGIEVIGRQAPLLIDQMSAALAKFDRVLDQFDHIDVGSRVVKVLDNANRVSQEARQLVKNIDAQVSGKDGIVATVTQTLGTIGALGRRASGSSDELDRTLRDVSDAAQAFRELVDEIQRDPDVLLKGRARTGRL